MKAWLNKNLHYFDFNQDESWYEVEVEDKELARNLNQKKEIDNLIINLTTELMYLQFYLKDTQLLNLRNQKIRDLMILERTLSIPEKFTEGKKFINYVNDVLNNLEDSNPNKNLYRNFAAISYYTITYLNTLSNCCREIAQVARLGIQDTDNFLSKGILINNIDMLLDLSKKLFYFIVICDWKENEIFKEIDNPHAKMKYNKEINQKFYNYLDEDKPWEAAWLIETFDTLRNAYQHRDILNKKEFRSVQYGPVFKSSNNWVIEKSLKPGDSVEKLSRTSDRFVHLIYGLTKREYFDIFLSSTECEEIVLFDYEKYEIFYLSIKVLKKLVYFYDRLVLRIRKNDTKYLGIIHNRNK